MRTYGQYCPIARTAEVISERWTPIIVRNLLAGCETFGQLLDGAPGISRALLAQRLDALERHGVITKEASADRRVRWTYALTERGHELKSVTDAMGHWGARWLELEPGHADPAYVLWATAKLVDLDRLDADGLTVRVELTDAPGPRWLLLRKPHPEVCTTSQGRSEDLVVRTNAETLAHVHLRHVTMATAVGDGTVVIDGAPRARRTFLAALRASPYVQEAQAPPA